MVQGVFRSLRKYLSRNRFGDVLVHRGLLSVSQLQEALDFQKKTGLALGEVLVSRGVISRWDLRTTLALQSSLRMTAAIVTLAVSAFCFVPRPAMAGSLKDIPASITLSAVSLEQARGVIQPALFGTAERRSSDLSSFTKWSDMFDRFNRDVTRESNNKILQQW
ncbi:MAG TPA: hypothetical protein PKZ89_03100, partial [Alphaproteobacteria bacterium]|nr:hypothetical protein [Alphaproteobacteria bacterium]